MSTSLMPTPGPPLREREGMMRRGRAAAALAPPVLEPEAEGAGGADAEGPACEAAGSVLEEGPPPLLLPLATAVVAACPAMRVVEFAGAAVVVTATTAGSADDADARLGMLPRRRRHKIFFSGVGVSLEKSGVLGRGWASSPLSVVPRPAPLWYLLCGVPTMASASNCSYLHFFLHPNRLGYKLQSIPSERQK